MGDEDTATLLAFVVHEVLGFAALSALLAAGLLGWISFAPDWPRSYRLGLLAFSLVELAVPLGVAVDVHRREDDPDSAWIHAAALPVSNLLSVLASLEDRRRVAR